MKLPNGYGSVVKLSGKRRKPYQVRKTIGWHYDEVKDKQVQDITDKHIKEIDEVTAAKQKEIMEI